jgi:tRNA-dihydrouridine synthase 4
MIIAESFNRSDKARDSDFSTSIDDRPLIVQFGTGNPHELAMAALKVAPYADGVDVNCGCPQRWAMQEGIGAALSAKPEQVSDLIRGAFDTCKSANMALSVKIRLHSDLRRTYDLIRGAELAGVDWITVHGRTAEQRTKVPARLEDIRTIAEMSSVPIVANGDAFSPKDIAKISETTGAKGIMSARGILANPAIFQYVESVPLECISDYLDLAIQYGEGRFAIHHHHLMFMLSRYLSRGERTQFAHLCSMSGIIDFFAERNWLKCQLKG